MTKKRLFEKRVPRTKGKRGLLEYVYTGADKIKRDFLKLDKSDREVIRYCAEELEIDVEDFERYVKLILKRLLERADKKADEITSHMKTIDEMDYDDYLKLFREIRFGSYYGSDYANSFGLDITTVYNIADGFVEDLWDLAEYTWEEEMSQEERDEYNDDYDEFAQPFVDGHFTPEEFANYAYGIEWADEDDYIDEEVVDELDKIYRDIQEYKDYLFEEEGVYELGGEYQHQLVKKWVGERFNRHPRKTVRESMRKRNHYLRLGSRK